MKKWEKESYQVDFDHIMVKIVRKLIKKIDTIENNQLKYIAKKVNFHPLHLYN